jgi:hypothetical protein
VVAGGAAGTVGTLLLYGSSEGAGGGEASGEPATQPTQPTGTGTRRLPDTGTPRSPGADAVGGAADEAADGAADTADAAQASPSTDDGIAASGGGTGSGGSGGGGGNTGGSSGGGSTGSGSGSNFGGGTPQRKWHEGWNEWVVDEPGHYNITIVHHDAVYYDKAVYGTMCDCGYMTTGSIYPHIDETGHRGYVTGVQVGTERELIEEAWDEEVREWVPEKGHNVWHEGYWE